MYETFIESVPLLKSLEVSLFFLNFFYVAQERNWTTVVAIIAPQLSQNRKVKKNKRETCLIKKSRCHAFNFYRLFSLQATERMRLLDVSGIKQFSDSERIISQVRLISGKVESFTIQLPYIPLLTGFTHVCMYVCLSSVSLSTGRQGFFFLYCWVWRGQDNDEE